MIGRGLIFSEDSNLVAQNNFPQASRSVRKLHTKSSCKSTCALSQFSARRRREHLNAYTCPCAPQTPLTHNGTKVAILSVARVQSINVGFSRIRRGRNCLVRRNRCPEFSTIAREQSGAGCSAGSIICAARDKRQACLGLRLIGGAKCAGDKFFSPSGRYGGDKNATSG
jgi:hypothetical protein